VLWSPYCLILFLTISSNLSFRLFPASSIQTQKSTKPHSFFHSLSYPRHTFLPSLLHIQSQILFFLSLLLFLSYRNHSSSTAFGPLPSFLFLHTYCTVSAPSPSPLLSPVHLILSRLYSPPGPSPWSSAKLTRTRVLGSLVDATFIGYG
jgi:hypothetical protein